MQLRNSFPLTATAGYRFLCNIQGEWNFRTKTTRTANTVTLNSLIRMNTTTISVQIQEKCSLNTDRRHIVHYREICSSKCARVWIRGDEAAARAPSELSLIIGAAFERDWWLAVKTKRFKIILRWYPLYRSTETLRIVITEIVYSLRRSGEEFRVTDPPQLWCNYKIWRGRMKP